MPEITPQLAPAAQQASPATRRRDRHDTRQDIFLHKAPAWVRYAPSPALAPRRPRRHHNVHIDSPVLSVLRVPAEQVHFHPSLYGRTLTQLRQAITQHARATADKPNAHQWATRLEQQLNTRLQLLKFCRQQASQLLAC